MLRRLPTVESVTLRLTSVFGSALVPVLLRVLLLVLVPVCALGVQTRAARADDAVVVLDRGRAAKAEARRYEQDALRLVEALGAHGHAARLALYGTRPDGRVRASRLMGDLEDRLGRAAAKEGWRYEGVTDPRQALEVSLRGYEGGGPLIVILVGPFAADAEAQRDGEADASDAREEEGEDGREGEEEVADGDQGSGEAADQPAAPDDAETPGSEALAAWAEKAPPGARVFAPDLSPASQRLILGARGVVRGGAIVLGAGEVVASPEPWSPLTLDAELRAAIEVELDVRTVGVGLRRPVLTGISSDGGSEITVPFPQAGFDSTPGIDTDEAPSAAARAGGGLGRVRLVVVRPLRGTDPASRVETVSFETASSPGVLWLTQPPQPRTIQWTELRPDARLGWFAPTPGLDPIRVNGNRPLDTDPLLVGSPLVRIGRVEHTRVGEAPGWTVRAAEGSLPAGMAIELGEVVNLTDEIAYRELELRIPARAGEPGSIEGTLVIEAAGHPGRFEVPYRLVVPPGRVVARLEAPPEPRRLPAGSDDVPWMLVVEERSPNAPPLVRVEAVLDPPELVAALSARLVGGGSVDVAWDLAGPLELRPGRRYALHLDLAPGVRGVEGTLALRLPAQRGVEGDAEGSGRLARRTPRLVAASDVWRYEMDGGVVVADPPLVLEVDADGGGGDWRLALLETQPTVSVPESAPIRFALRPQAPGRWALVPDGDWTGTRGDTFSPRRDAITVQVDWSAGDAPGPLALQVDVRPRWGMAGWILAGLAALAAALGLWGLLQMKAAPVEGTLLYQMEGRAGAVGRLDLAPSGRRTTIVHPDAAGRLVLASKRRPDAEPLVVVRPTRVGGLLEIPSADAPERHLLVDGLTVQVGRYRIRYISAHPGDASVPTVSGPEEELLGPEFDLPSGRIDALEGAPSPDAERHEAD